MANTTHPTFSLSIGALKATSARPAGAPGAIVVERDMDVAADGLRVRLSDRSNVKLGDAVTLDLGYAGTESPVFAGTVARLRPTLDGVDVWALGGLHLLLDLYAANVYDQQSAGAIARDLVGKAGLTAGTIDDGPKLPRFAVDVRSSAHAHLAGLARRLGYELYADVSGKAMFHALGAAAGLDGPAAAAPAGGAATAVAHRYGADVLELAAVSAPPIWESVAVGGESPMSGQGDKTVAWLTTDDAAFRGSKGSGGRHLLVADPVARTKDLADRFAAGQLAVAARGTREVLVSVPGRAAVDLGETLSIADHPDALAGGKGYVRALAHRVDDVTGFVTQMRLALEPAP
jgi:hypothetical protein